MTAFRRQWATEQRWGGEDRALPHRWVPTSLPADRSPDRKPFNFSAHIRRLCADVAARSPTFAHVNPSAMLFTFTTSRSRGRHGLLARVCPLRFRDGGLYRRARGGLYQVQRFFVDQRELLYVVTFCLPRFLDLPFEEKLITVFHELYHVSPQFDGDLRRHDGRYQFHTHSKKGYDERMAALVREYLAGHPAPSAFAFLHHTFAQLWTLHGGVYGIVVPKPLMVPVPACGA